MKDKEYLTKEKHEAMKAELNELKTKGRKEIAEQLEYAKSLGDLSENAEYQEARGAQAEIEERIQKLEEVLKNAEIVKAHHSDAVDVGSTVCVKKEGSSDKICYQIVGSEEANTKEGKISNRSPIGEAMYGKKKGDSFEVKTPKGMVRYTIVEVK
jgi:transcription elongation factor GreA